MIIVLLIISVALFIYLACCYDFDTATIAVVGFVIKLGVLIYLLAQLIGLRVIDNKIELYKNQNKEIENKVELVVIQYMKHEKDTFVKLKTNESYITLVTLYPELKSDKLIKEEIKLYEENNKKILNLKEQKINEKLYKWWIYFGG